VIAFPPHLDESLDFDRFGGRQRVLDAFEADEEIQYASPGWFEEIPAMPSKGKRHDGLLVITNHRVVLIRRPGAMRKNPKPIALPFETISNAGPHKEIPNTVVVLSDASPMILGYYLELAVADAPDAVATIWGTTILESAEANGEISS
jgi:hypothetical protein